MRNVERLVEISRRNTENQDFSEENGITTDEILGYYNRAQESMQARISSVNADLFQVEKIIDVAPKTESVSIPDDAFLGNMVDLVEYSPDNNTTRWYKLKQGRLQERISRSYSGNPSFYIRRSGSLLLQPETSRQSKIRLTYQKALPSLDIRRGTVLSATLATDTITTLTLDSTKLIDRDALLEEEYITIVNKDGDIKMRRTPIDDVDVATGVVTVSAGFTFEEGETIEAGDYALRGGDSTTHSQLPKQCERYLTEYADWKLLKRDSSQDSAEESQELVAMATTIIEAFAKPDSDPDYVTILDNSYLDTGDDYY